MGKIKDKFIDEINKQNLQDDVDWNYEPTPEIIEEDGKKMWEIENYKIWAFTYKDALKLLEMIKS